MRKVKFYCIFIACLNVKIAVGQDYFNPQFLGEDVASIEQLSFLTSGNQLPPGVYYMYIYSGEQFLKNMKVVFSMQQGKVQPCFTKEIVESIPLSEDIKAIFRNFPESESKCIDLSKYIKEFNYEVNLSKLTLTLSIPQVYLDSTYTTMAPENEWDDGIPAFLVNYNYNGSYSKNQNASNYVSNYINLNNRVNIGPWRVNADVYFNENKYGDVNNHQVDTSNVNISRKINKLKSELTLGQSTLGSNLFDSNAYIGATLATSNEMLPDSDRGYSPTIRGIAESRSKLTVKQNNTIIYQTYVNPGPYNINNLNSVGTSGDYVVELTSSEGLVKKFTVPYSSLPNLLRPGKFNYALTIGKLDLNSLEHANFFQGTTSVGMPFNSTLFLGAQLSSNYASTGIGLGKDFGQLGALSIDALNAIAKLDEERSIGGSYRALYSKSFSETGTNIQFTGYRYSTANYYSLSEAVRKKNLQKDGFYDYYYGRRKDSLQLNVSQNLGDYGQLYAWGNINSYWESDAKSKNLQFGWNKNFPQYNNILITASYNKKTYNNISDDIFYLSFSMPLTKANATSTMYVSNSMNYNKSDYNDSVSIYGNTLDNKLDYNIYQTINKNSSYNNSNISVDYKANSSILRGGYTYTRLSQQFDYGVSGGFLLHKDGLTFTRVANDTAILVEAKGAEGAKITRAGENITINRDGYALIPYATPYHYNDVELDPSSFSKNYDIDNKIAKVAPTRGAISKVIFDVKKGYSFLVKVKYKKRAIRFGTVVENKKEHSISIADDDGTVYLTGVKNNASYDVAWDDKNSCRFQIKYNDESRLKPVNKIEVECL